MSTDLHLRPFIRKHLNSNDFAISALAGDASTRKYFRIGQESSSWVLMSWEPFDRKNYPFLSVHDLFSEFKVMVPKVHAVSEAEGLILLEDLGDLTLERKFWENLNSDNILPYYRMAIDELIKINFLASRIKSESTAFKAEFDHAKLFWELEHAYQNLFVDLLQQKISAGREIKIKAELSQVASLLAEEPKHIAHRDYHSRNLMVKMNHVYVIDFQDARLGSITYDLASLLKDPYVALAPATEATLIKYFLEQARPHLPTDFSVEAFHKTYNLQSFQRCFKAVGTFTSMFNKKQDRRYLKNIFPALQRIHESTQQISALTEFKSLFVESGAQDFRYEKL